MKGCKPACSRWHWCVHCALSGRKPTHALLCKDIYINKKLVTRYPACLEHKDREVPPQGVKVPWTK